MNPNNNAGEKLPGLRFLNNPVHADNKGIYVHIRTDSLTLKKYLFEFYCEDLWNDDLN